MRPPLQSATVLVTGASSGIGREVARQLAPLARALVLVARREERLVELAEELRARHGSLRISVQRCDLADRPAVDRMLGAAVGEVGEIDVLVNSAGFGDVALLESASWQKLEQMVQVNVVALTYLTRRLIEPMLRRGRGGVLNISSSLGLIFLPGFAAYSGTKHYVTAFSESLRSELRGTGVVVSQVCPGPVATEFLEVAGNPLGRDVPRFLQISAERCARIALRAFARGRALVVPGLLMKLSIGLGRLTPRWLLRGVFALFARMLRKRQPMVGR